MATIHGEYNISLTDRATLGDLVTRYLGTNFPENVDMIGQPLGQWTILPWINNETEEEKEDYVGTNTVLHIRIICWLCFLRITYLYARCQPVWTDLGAMQMLSASFATLSFICLSHPRLHTPEMISSDLTWEMATVCSWEARHWTAHSHSLWKKLKHTKEALCKLLNGRVSGWSFWFCNSLPFCTADTRKWSKEFHRDSTGHPQIHSTSMLQEFMEAVHDPAICGKLLDMKAMCMSIPVVIWSVSAVKSLCSHSNMQVSATCLMMVMLGISHIMNVMYTSQTVCIPQRMQNLAHSWRFQEMSSLWLDLKQCALTISPYNAGLWWPMAVTLPTLIKTWTGSALGSSLM